MSHRARALYDYEPTSPSELPLVAGEEVTIQVQEGGGRSSEMHNCVGVMVFAVRVWHGLMVSFVSRGRGQ